MNDLVYGIRAILESIEAGNEINKLMIQKGLQGDLMRELRQAARESNLVIQEVPKEKLNRITSKNHQGAICFVSPVSYYRIDTLLPMLFEEGKTPLLVILDNVTDVRNMGAIARTAMCANAHALIIPRQNSATVTADAMKASAGALATLPVCREPNLVDVVRYLQQSGVQVVAGTEKAEKAYWTADYTMPTAIVLGSEDVGISTNVMRVVDELVRIPIDSKPIDSLNVSVATGILLFEAVKQRLLVGV